MKKDDLEPKLLEFLKQRYVVRQTSEEKARGLAFITAEQHDLAKQIVGFLDRSGALASQQTAIAN